MKNLEKLFQTSPKKQFFLTKFLNHGSLCIKFKVSTHNLLENRGETFFFEDNFFVVITNLNTTSSYGWDIHNGITFQLKLFLRFYVTFTFHSFYLFFFIWRWDVLLDVIKSFDNLRHEVLLHKLETYDIKDDIFNSLCNYLQQGCRRETKIWNATNICFWLFTFLTYINNLSDNIQSTC